MGHVTPRKAPTVHQKVHVWKSATVVHGKDPGLYRQDVLGNVVYKPSYGKNSKMGWHIDHKRPLAVGGSNHTRNLHILQSSANLSKGASYR
jgi:5-methylcytosine-specific restriction endonuclease McrA